MVRHAHMPRACGFCPWTCKIVWLCGWMGKWFFSYTRHILIFPSSIHQVYRASSIISWAYENFCRACVFLGLHAQWACKLNVHPCNMLQACHQTGKENCDIPGFKFKPNHSFFQYATNQSFCIFTGKYFFLKVVISTRQFSRNRYLKIYIWIQE